ncbi:MAG: RIP metalloprotease RseP [Victivallales bacterium]|nr:RIP metalloprotease RseP [Victivallales bacterium]MCF7889029.1 RIP metalloprotease RseP [Victivallales bacterium]
MIYTFLHYLFVAFFVLFFFGFCIFIHELGHFLAAKWRKMHIVAFSIGFKTIWSFKRNGIEYRIGCLPFGGYVDIPQLESNEKVKVKNGKVLPPVSPVSRMIVAFAGPFFNILFGLVLASFLWIHGIPESTPKMSTIEVARINKESPEYKAGLRNGDKIVKINGENFYKPWSKIVQKFIFSTDSVKLGVKQEDGSIKTVKYEPAVNRTSIQGKAYAKEGLPYPFFSPVIPLIIKVEPGSPAYKAGLRSGDRILKLDNYRPLDFMEYASFISKTNGAPFDLKIKRNNKFIELNDIKPKKYTEKKKRYLIGIYTKNTPQGVQITRTVKNSAAFEAGLIKGDIILSVNSTPVKEPASISKIIQKTKGKPVSIKIKRNDRIILKKLTPRLSNERIFYLPGVSVVFYNHINPFVQFYNVIEMSYKSIKGIFSTGSKIKAKHLSGPVGIISIIGKAVYMGMIIQALNIITIITFCLALMNLLPLPVLDGGHILISFLEIIFRRHLPTRLMQPICMLFAILLIALMIFVTYNDVNRLVNFKNLFSTGKKDSKSTQKTHTP